MHTRPVLVLALLTLGWAGCSAQATPAPEPAAPVGLEALPQGWIRAGRAPTAYEMGLDAANVHGSNATLTLASKPEATLQPNDFGTVMTTTDATPYHGKRVRFRGFARSEAVVSWAALWMRVDGASGGTPLAFDNMQGRPISATSDWAQYDVVLDVDPSATKIAYGALLSGRGSIWFDPSKLEIVDASVPTTGQAAPAKFEAARATGLTPTWFLNGTAVSSYVAGPDSAVHHGGATSVSVASTGAVPAGKFGGAMQIKPIPPELRGGHVRLSAYVKTANVTGWTALWLRIDGEPGTKPLAFDNMYDHGIKGTVDWAPYSIVLNVPPDARSIALGVLLVGAGHVWMDDVVLERVD